jgi:hypothetical protein
MVASWAITPSPWVRLPTTLEVVGGGTTQPSRRLLGEWRNHQSVKTISSAYVCTCLKSH